MNEDVFVYRIDIDNTIVTVSRNWDSFAHGNAWNSECRPEDVVGHSLWDFIHDTQTRDLYEEVFRRVRVGKPCGPIPFRCDSPCERRFLELVLEPLPDGMIEIVSTIVRTELRDPVRLLDGETERSKDIIMICSICKKIETPPNGWTEVETGLSTLRPFECDRMPLLTHGVCPDCYQVVMAELNDSKPPE